MILHEYGGPENPRIPPVKLEHRNTSKPDADVVVEPLPLGRCAAKTDDDVETRGLDQHPPPNPYRRETFARLFDDYPEIEVKWNLAIDQLLTISICLGCDGPRVHSRRMWPTTFCLGCGNHQHRPPRKLRVTLSKAGRRKPPKDPFPPRKSWAKKRPCDLCKTPLKADRKERCIPCANRRLRELHQKKRRRVSVWS